MRTALLAILLVACGNSNKDGTLTPDASSGSNSMPPPDGRPVDVPPAQAMLTISGQTFEVTTSGPVPRAGVTVSAYRNADPNMPVATATSDAQGNYSLDIVTNGEPIDGYLHATLTGMVDTYLYPPYPVFEDFDLASVFLVSRGNETMNGNWENLDNLTGGDQEPGKGIIALVVTDGATPVGGATVTTTPELDVYYNAMVGGFALPLSTATETHTDGIAYVKNALGSVRLDAQATGLTFSPTTVHVRGDVLTTTLVVP